jgi:dephospho-CoA kinase
MLKIGITGGIGSGKTIVCEVFKQLRIPVFTSDLEAKKLLDTPFVLEFYRNNFGESVFTEGLLDKRKIASLIFENQEAKQKVNDFIHPLVMEAFSAWALTQKNCLYVIKEAALLFESNAYMSLNYSVLVHAPIELRIKRVMERDNCSGESVVKRIRSQMPEENKMKLANFVISNDEHSLLLPQVLSLHQKFCNEAVIKNKGEA